MVSVRHLRPRRNPFALDALYHFPAGRKDGSVTSKDFEGAILACCWRTHCIAVLGTVGLARSGFPGLDLEGLCWGVALAVVIDRASSQLHRIAGCP